MKINNKSSVLINPWVKIAQYWNCKNRQKEIKHYYDLLWNLDPNNKHWERLSICTMFEGIFMLASMLYKDRRNPWDYDKMGYKNSGMSNPYDYSWFDDFCKDENYPDNEITTLDIFKEWIKKNYEIFENVYNLVSDIKLKPDYVWNLVNDCDI